MQRQELEHLLVEMRGQVPATAVGQVLDRRLDVRPLQGVGHHHGEAEAHAAEHPVDRAERRRDVAALPPADLRPVPLTLLRQKEPTDYRLDRGDVLAVVAPNVLGPSGPGSDQVQPPVRLPDQMNQTAKAVALFEVQEFAPHMRDMSGIIVEAARVTAEAIPLLRSLAANAGRLHTLTERLIELEGHADEIHDAGLKALFKASREHPMDFVVGQEIYAHLEKSVDRFEDVANEIQGLVIDHA